MDKPTVTMEISVATKEDINRLDLSIKELTTAVKDVILLGERQAVQGKRIGDLETLVGVLQKQVETTERKLDSWINRGIGAWAIVLISGAIIKLAIGH